MGPPEDEDDDEVEPEELPPEPLDEVDPPEVGPPELDAPELPPPPSVWISGQLVKSDWSEVTSPASAVIMR